MPEDPSESDIEDAKEMVDHYYMIYRYQWKPKRQLQAPGPATYNRRERRASIDNDLQIGTAAANATLSEEDLDRLAILLPEPEAPAITTPPQLQPSTATPRAMHTTHAQTQHDLTQTQDKHITLHASMHDCNTQTTHDRRSRVYDFRLLEEEGEERAKEVCENDGEEGIATTSITMMAPSPPAAISSPNSS